MHLIDWLIVIVPLLIIAVIAFRAHHFVRPWETPRDDPGVRAVAAALESAGQSVVIAGAPFSCDLAIYGEVGQMPCVLLGPRWGSLHAPDEWADIEDILNLTATFAELASSWCAKSIEDE